MSKPLTGKQRRYLRSLAHHLEPVVQIGTSGVTPGVLEEIRRALHAHELIKVRVSSEAAVSAEEAASPIEAEANAHIAQVIGRTLVVYRPRDENPKIQLPRGPDGE